MKRTFGHIIYILLAVCLVTIVPHLDLIPVPFGYTIPILLLVWYLLRIKNENFATIGFKAKGLTVRAACIGSLAGVIIYSFLNFVFFPLIKHWIHFPEVQIDLYNQLKGNTGFFIFILIMGWVVGGLYEEIVFHGFLFTRIESIIPKRMAAWVGLILTNVIFGFYHFQLGAEGIVNALLAGFGYHIVILMNNRNLWYGIFAHAVFDSIAITQLYLGM